MTNKPIIMIGNGGHASVLTEILLQQKRNIKGFTAPKDQENRFNLPYLGEDKVIYKYNPDEIELVLGIGSINVSRKREEIFNQYKQQGFFFASVIHNSAIISPTVKTGEGLQIMANVVIQPFVEIDDNTIINTSTSIDHESRIGKHCHLAPGSTLSGNVSIGNSTHVGTGSIFIQNVKIGNNVLIGAGSLVITSINDNCKAYGVPAKEV
ncbi:acetyltransferase [Neobacillus rhizosphaerae]|uniref:acetyltransferase n=1 Tax=Neobacillus rhizosphaerae TaxID=2880965 RepID=UPI003D290A64